MNDSQLKRSAIILGASGLTGSKLLEFLLDDNTWSSVISLVRIPAKLKHPKLSQKVIEFDNLPYYSSLIKADDVFCCLGTTIKRVGSQEEFKKVDFEYPVEIAKIALKNGSKNFYIISSLGANANSKLFYYKTKGEVEEEICKLEFKSINIFRPSILAGKRKQFRFGEKVALIIMNLLSFLFIGKLKKYKPIRAQLVAKAMIKAAKENRNGINIFESDEMQQAG